MLCTSTCSHNPLSAQAQIVGPKAEVARREHDASARKEQRCSAMSSPGPYARCKQSVAMSASWFRRDLQSSMRIRQGFQQQSIGGKQLPKVSTTGRSPPSKPRVGDPGILQTRRQRGFSAASNSTLGLPRQGGCAVAWDSLERIDVVGDVVQRQLSCLVEGLLDPLRLRAAEEGLGDCIVPTCGFRLILGSRREERVAVRAVESVESTAAIQSATLIGRIAVSTCVITDAG
jgi:hypothetical protein